MAQLEGTENRISVERKRYNDAVRDYNVKCREFPTLIAAKIWHFKPKEPFKATTAGRREGAGGEVLNALVTALFLLLVPPGADAAGERLRARVVARRRRAAQSAGAVVRAGVDAPDRGRDLPVARGRERSRTSRSASPRSGRSAARRTATACSSVLFVKEHKIRIEVGYGLEGQLTDVQAQRIEDELMAPRFREGDYEGGLRAALAAIDTATGGHEHAEGKLPARAPTSGGGGAHSHRRHHLHRLRHHPDHSPARRRRRRRQRFLARLLPRRRRRRLVGRLGRLELGRRRRRRLVGRTAARSAAAAQPVAGNPGG